MLCYRLQPVWNSIRLLKVCSVDSMDWQTNYMQIQNKIHLSEPDRARKESLQQQHLCKFIVEIKFYVQVSKKNISYNSRCDIYIKTNVQNAHEQTLPYISVSHAALICEFCFDNFFFAADWPFQDNTKIGFMLLIILLDSVCTSLIKCSVLA